MARIRRRHQAGRRRCDGPGWRSAAESILAGPAQGCNGATVRRLTVEPEGKTPRKALHGSRILHLISGSVLFMDGDGATHRLEEGDSVVIDAGERHHMVNGSGSPASLFIVDMQKGT